MKIVIDTNIFISSMFGGNPHDIVELWKHGDVQLCVSHEILLEYKRVFDRIFGADDESVFSVFVFFNANSMIGLMIGSVLAGIANGGASIAWSLWVTKLAPVGLESEYMGAHVFMTGLRGFLAPFLGYAVLGQLGFQGVSYVSCGLILCSLLVFLTALRSTRL